ncbi:MAG: DUF1552 domain-containing protein [Pseudohongiellaceae bacterium]|uniref:DUF1552 domain-containing protein n=1 Tax=OM182 bacterium MED-G28 TaxID=1986256 RepID=A0A2A5WA94_9GAMM|nr:hypothetical protein [Gammaproteobacteria bacterium]PDH33455.1 MAG: hypothetical protein CNF02_08385 [OM182 bacterium MED-G28]
MIITKKAIPRRAMLRGFGAALALPMLDAMIPAMANTAPKPIKRLGIVYVPNGMRMDHWTPSTVGDGFEFPSILKPMEPFREQLQIISGLHGVDGEGPHARASTRFLTGVASTRDNGSNLRAGISMDQIAGRFLGNETQLSTLELAIDGRDFAGSCDEGFSCAYTNTITWANETTPLPMENNPRAIFERLFGDTGSTDPKVRRARLSKDASLLDSVTQRAQDLSRQLGASDQTKLGQYLEAVRDVERRIQMAEAQSDRELPVVDQPAGIPDTFAEHARLMFDMMALAWETDMTRVATFMMGREITGRTYAEIGVPDAHHPISHHQRDPVKLEKLLKINQYHMTFFAEFLDRLRTSEDANGSLLDSSMIVYGAGMADSNSHYSRELPIMLAGNVAHGGYHLQYPEATPLSNMHLGLLDKLGTPIESLGDSTGRLSI